MHKLAQDLIESITNEKRKFDMSAWSTPYLDGTAGQCEPVYRNVPTCGTAACMAGHLIAIRRQKALRLVANEPHLLGYPGRIAAKIWENETGTECRLDFYGCNQESRRIGSELPYRGLYQLTRAEAVSHIKGRSRKWPLLPKREA